MNPCVNTTFSTFFKSSSSTHSCNFSPRPIYIHIIHSSLYFFSIIIAHHFFSFCSKIVCVCKSRANSLTCNGLSSRTVVIKCEHLYRIIHMYLHCFPSLVLLAAGLAEPTVLMLYPDVCNVIHCNVKPFLHLPCSFLCSLLPSSLITGGTFTTKGMSFVVLFSFLFFINETNHL